MILILSNIDKVGDELNALILSNFPLDFHDFFHSFSHVKGFDVFSKLPRLDLGVIKQVLDHETHQVGRRFLNAQTIFELQ
jgi:hypothetical protein